MPTTTWLAECKQHNTFPLKDLGDSSLSAEPLSVLRWYHPSQKLQISGFVNECLLEILCSFEFIRAV